MLSYFPNHSKQLKPTKVFKLQWTASIWCQKHQTTQNYKSDQITTKCMDLTSKRTKMFCYVGNHWKQRKSTKVIKVQWSAWIWRQNEQKCWVTSQTIQNNANLKKKSKYNELHRFDVKTIKMLSYVPNHCKHSQTTKVIKWRWIASIWRKNDQKCLVTSQTIQNNSNLQKYSNYNELHRFDVKNIKQRKTIKVIKLRWSAWIWRQNEQKCWVTSQTIQNNSNLQKYSNYNELHRFDVKNIKQRKTTKVIKVQWSAWIWRQNEQKCWVTSQTIQNNSNLQKYSNYNELHRFDVKNIKQRKTTKVIKLRLSAWIWRQNEQKCFVTSETIENNANLQKLSKYNEVHGFDVKTNKNVELRRKPFQTQQNYKSDQITMKCMDLTSKRTKLLSYVPNHSKHSKTTKVIKLLWSAWIWRQNEQKCWVTSQTIQNNANLKKESKYNELHRFDVKTIKMLSYVPNHSKHSKTTKVIKLRWIASIWRQNDQKCFILRPKLFKTTQTYKSIQITMNCIDLMSKTSNNAKLQKWSNYDEVHGFDVKTNKNVVLRRKPFKTTQIYKSYQSTMNCIDLMSKR